jgi:hypothetical protein
MKIFIINRREVVVKYLTSGINLVISTNYTFKLSFTLELPKMFNFWVQVAPIYGIVFLPCGHGIACINCSISLNTCAVCRQIITATVRVIS